MSEPRQIRRLRLIVYCWANETKAVKEAFLEWFGNEEHTLCSGKIKIEPISGDEEREVRVELEEGDGILPDDEEDAIRVEMEEGDRVVDRASEDRGQDVDVPG